MEAVIVTTGYPIYMSAVEADFENLMKVNL